MIGRPLRLAQGADANGSYRNTEPRTAGRAAFGAAEAIWWALIAGLVALAAAGANPSRGLTGSSPGCLFAGKAGVICNGSAIAAVQTAAENAERCLSFGNGGRFCPPAK
jgi:hypothetical protein